MMNDKPIDMTASEIGNGLHKHEIETEMLTARRRLLAKVGECTGVARELLDLERWILQYNYNAKGEPFTATPHIIGDDDINPSPPRN